VFAYVVEPTQSEKDTKMLMSNDVIFSYHLSWKTMMKIQKNNKMKIVHFITSFNQLHGFQVIRSTYHKILQALPSEHTEIEIKKKTGHYR
jgi:N-acetylglucosamine-6-phosphate deacetylase